jgi:hypothetical protein
MSKQKWKFTEHSEALADTGDYDYYVSFTNGKDVLQTSSCDLEEKQLQEFCDLLDAMPDLWSHEIDATKFENSLLRNQIELIQLKLPKKTYNCEPFGLMFMIDGSGDFWTCQYYSHYSKKSDDRFPQQNGKTIDEAAAKMFDFINENYPSMLSSKQPDLPIKFN